LATLGDMQWVGDSICQGCGNAVLLCITNELYINDVGMHMISVPDAMQVLAWCGLVAGYQNIFLHIVVSFGIIRYWDYSLLLHHHLHSATYMH
jgi:hypothetical protein